MVTRTFKKAFNELIQGNRFEVRNEGLFGKKVATFDGEEILKTKFFHKIVVGGHEFKYNKRSGFVSTDGTDIASALDNEKLRIDLAHRPQVEAHQENIVNQRAMDIPEIVIAQTPTVEELIEQNGQFSQMLKEAQAEYQVASDRVAETSAMLDRAFAHFEPRFEDEYNVELDAMAEESGVEFDDELDAMAEESGVEFDGEPDETDIDAQLDEMFANGGYVGRQF